jgi:SAM-dependent methyltransferase
MRRPVRGFFDRLAGGWDERVRPDAPEHLAALAAAVSRLEAPPAAALDLGTGTGAGALWLARQFPEARVTGLDISEAMIEQARAKLHAELSRRVEFLVGDADRLPFADGSFELVAQISVPVFFDEAARVLAPGGYVVVVSSLGVKTPFHTPERTLRNGFRRRGIEVVAAGRPVRVCSSWADSLPRPYASDRAPAKDTPIRIRSSSQPAALPSSRTSTATVVLPRFGRHRGC